MMRYVAAVVVGGVLGALMGNTRSCETGACPLTSNPYVGAAYGALLAFLLVSTLGGPSWAGKASADKETPMTTHTESAVVSVKTVQEYRDAIRNASVPVLVDLWAPWCAPCRAQLPIVEEIANQAGDRARVIKVNVDELGEVAVELGVSSIPTLVVFGAGRETGRFVGVQSAATLSRALGL